jgi:nucleotide-binding universal stress UspA family protein
MSYVTIMVHAEADGELPAYLGIAADLAARFGSHLIGIAARAPMSVFLAEDARRGNLAGERHLQDMTTLLDRQGERFCAALERAPRPVEWRSVLDFPTEAVAREARAADLVIAGREQGARDPSLALAPARLVLTAGRPVLLVPPGATALQLRRIAIAWKDTREARRATRDALPLLREAESVLIVAVRDPGEPESPTGVEDVERFLARHGVAATAAQSHRSEVTVTDTLLAVTEAENVDLLVAGAYGHSRLGEWMFGGVTRDLLRRSPTCCLFSH